LDAPLLAASDRESTAFQFFSIISSGEAPPASVLDPLLATQLTAILQGISPGADPVQSLISLAPTDIEVIAEAFNLDEDTVALIMAVSSQFN
jgi:hypothetical protein